MVRGLQVPYREYGVKEGESPKFQFDIESARNTRIYDVDWLNGGIACYQLLGYPTMDNSNPSAPLINRYLPQQDGDFPWMVCTKISEVRGIGSRSYITANGLTVAKYEKARITAQFEMPDYDVLEDAYIESEFDRYRTFEAKPSAEYLSIPLTGSLKWSNGPNGPANPNGAQPFPGNVGRVVQCVDYCWDWIQVPFEAMPEDDIQNTIGRVNKYEFANCPPHSLLLLGWEPVRKNSPYGLRTWRIRYTARYNPNLHTNFYDFDPAHFGTPSYNPGWHQASVDGAEYTPGSVPDGKLLYDERDFELLFTPPAITP